MAVQVEKLITEHLDLWTQAQTAKSTSGRGSNNKIELTGIKKLRELILELAVRGKLVPQDPNDESASELLKRIAAEKEALVKAGKLKKQKPLPPISNEEKPYQLPHGWSYVRLGEVVEIERGITFPASEKSKSPEAGRVACLRTTNVQDKIEWDDLLFIRKQFVNRPEQFVRKFDIVMSMANSRELVGKVALVEHEPEYATSFGGFLSVLRPTDIHAKFLMIVLRTPHIKGELIGSASQTTNIANISLAKLNPLVLAIPPLSEQKSIVTKVEELMHLCDQLEQQSYQQLDAHNQLVDALLVTLTQSQNADELASNWQRLAAHFDSLFTTEYSIDALKQTILQLAVMGKLVKQDPNDEPASELLKRIAAEKDALVKAGKIKKQKPLPPISDDEKPFELPEGWVWARLGSILEIKGGKRVSNGYQLLKSPTPYIYIRVSDFKNESIDDSDLHYIDEKMRNLISRYVISKDDIYMTIVGATIGKCGIVPDKFDNMNLTENAARLILPKCFSKIFVLKCLTSDFCQKQFLDNTKQVGVQKMALNRLSSSIIPIPPAHEQSLIASKVEELMALCDAFVLSLKGLKQIQTVLAEALLEKVVA